MPNYEVVITTPVHNVYLVEAPDLHAAVHQAMTNPESYKLMDSYLGSSDESEFFSATDLSDDT